MRRIFTKRRIFTLILGLVLVFGLFAIASASVGGAPVVMEDAEGAVEYQSNMYATFWSLVPPIIAIILALVTKEVYTSLFIGILAGGLFYANFNPELTLTTIFTDGMIAKLSDSWNVGILIFLVVLGIMVVMMNKAGGSAAYGRWARGAIKSKTGAQAATFGLGVLIFVDDYFNCLTVGSVMRPVTDKFGISRAKLAYLIDATAAPVCIIAPISSWAAAVTGVVQGYDGIELFIRTIPYNFYALLTIVMMICITFMKFDFGPMKKHEDNAAKGDLYTTAARPFGDETEEETSPRAKVIDLILPVAVLIISCILGMTYTGGLFQGTDFVTAFSECDASAGLVYGSVIALIFTTIYYLCRRVLTFKQFSESIPDGFKAMVPAILILTFAWTLSAMTAKLGAAEFVAGIVEATAGTLASFLPAIIFLVALGLAFATGTSWGTFGILLPIVVAVLPASSELLIVSMSACLAGAVCGDHCSPISDTTIMASTGAKSDHINHVSTQLPYALLVAGISFVGYLITGFVQNWFIMLPVMIAVTVGILFFIRWMVRRRDRVSA